MMPDRELELFHLEHFLTGLGILPEVAAEQSEAPDFLLRIGGRKIGVEHTQFFFPPQAGELPQQQLDALQDLSVEQARRIFRENGGPALYVSPIFDERRSPHTKQQAYELAERLAAVVARNGWPARPMSSTFETWMDLPEIHGYTVMESVDGVDELWSGGSGGWVAPIEPHHIQTCLDAKAANHYRYARQAEEVWLLLVNDIFRGGAPCELGDSAAHANYTFPFNRAFWFEFASGRVTELSRR